VQVSGIKALQIWERKMRRVKRGDKVWKKYNWNKKLDGGEK
jgi:hypothetical protein